MNNLIKCLHKEVELFYRSYLKNVFDDEAFETFKKYYFEAGETLKETINQYVDVQLQAYLNFDKGKTIIQDSYD